MTDPLGQSQVLPYLLGLAKKGHVIHLISFEKPDRFENTKNEIYNICEQGNITWHPHVYTKTPPVLSTLKDIRNLYAFLKKLHNEQHFDIIHARSYISMIAAFPMQKLGTKVLFDMRGFWADERIDGSIWNLKNPLYKCIYSFFKKREKRWVEKSDAVVSLTYAAAEYMTKEFDVSRPIHVIPCCTDEKVFAPVNENSIQSDDLVYVGSLGTWYLLDEMLAFFKVWKDYFPQAKFRFITLESKEYILNSAKKVGLTEQDFLIGPAKRNEVAGRIEGAKAGVFFIKNSFSKMASSPVKQGEIMSMGLPIFCNTGVGDSERIIETYNSGILINEYTKKEFQRAIEEYRKTAFSVSSIRNGAAAYFSLAQGIEKYHSIYHSL